MVLCSMHQIPDGLEFLEDQQRRRSRGHREGEGGAGRIMPAASYTRNGSAGGECDDQTLECLMRKLAVVCRLTYA